MSSNKRIAKNTLMLYIRMLISMLVGLYTSRVVLQTLGAEDYGIYGVVGGVVGMMGFLNASMSGATSRFITFELGKGDMQRVRDTFSSAMIIHIGIALVVILLAETVGLWFLCNKLVIPEGRMEAAHWVYQCSIISAAVGITQSPYTAVIMSREKMDIYAYMELLNVSLKLGIVYLLVIGNFDKLILYAILTLAVSVLMAMLYRMYCIRHYEESNFSCVWNKEQTIKMVSFSLYNLFGNFGWVVNNQGTNFIINTFFGVVYNAAASVATTVSSTVNSFASNIMTAFRPAVVKAYARKEYDSFENLLILSIKSILFVYSLIAIPVALSADQLLSLWLVEVPPCAVEFSNLMLISLFWEILKQLVVMGIHASGKVRRVSTISSILYCINPLIVYVCFRYDMSVIYAYISAIFMHCIISGLDIFILKQEAQGIHLKRFFLTIISVLIVNAMTCVIVYYASTCLNSEGLLDILSKCIITFLVLPLLSFYFVLDGPQRKQVLATIIHKLSVR